MASQTRPSERGRRRRSFTTTAVVAAAAIAVVVNDLLRRRLSLGLVWLATRLFWCHPISRHDGPLSVRRSYSSAELRVLAEKAGARQLTIHEYRVLGRMLAVLS